MIIRNPFSVCFASIAIGLICYCSPLEAQSSLTWEQLAEVKFSDQYLESTGTIFSNPEFAKSLKKRQGERVFIVGYLLPLDVYGKTYALSANPFAACYFCGKSGPESVMELEFNKTESWFAMDRLVMIEGNLFFNESDPTHLYYLLKDAEAIERLDK